MAKENEEVLNEQVEELRVDFIDNLDELQAEQNTKEFGNRCKAVETLLKVSNQSKQIELDSKRLDFEIEQAKQQHELEQQRLELDKNVAEVDKKDKKKTFWLGVAKIAVCVLGTVAGIGLTIWSVVVGMKFEETGDYRSSVSKFAQNFCQKTLSKLDKINPNV